MTARPEELGQLRDKLVADGECFNAHEASARTRVWRSAGVHKIFAAFIAIFIFQASARAAEKIRIGFPDLAAPFVPLAVGQKRGFFPEEGLQAELIRMNPAIAFPALVVGEIDYYTVTGPGVAAAIRGVPVRLVASDQSRNQGQPLYSSESRRNG